MYAILINEIVPFFFVFLFCTDSWIELTPGGQTVNTGIISPIAGTSGASSNAGGPRTPERVTPLPFSSGDEYLRLLREAQRESGHSSLVVSLASSRRDTPRGSPKSPPNSPNTELCNGEDLKGIYINYWNKVSTAVLASHFFLYVFIIALIIIALIY